MRDADAEWVTQWKLLAMRSHTRLNVNAVLASFPVIPSLHSFTS